MIFRAVSPRLRSLATLFPATVINHRANRLLAARDLDIAGLGHRHDLNGIRLPWVPSRWLVTALLRRNAAAALHGWCLRNDGTD